MGYKVPEIVRNELTYSFLEEFRDLLFRKSKFLSLSNFADEISMFENTDCFIEALRTTAEKHNSTVIMQYYDSISEHDEFDAYPKVSFCSAITNLLIEYRLILNYSTKLFEKELGISPINIVFCNECCGYFPKDQTILVEYYNEDNSEYNRCLSCNDNINML
jgi:hypothetical protein